MKNKCLFENQLYTKKGRPCKDCKKKKLAWSASPLEIEGRCEWWVAEIDDGRLITFRIFPGTPEEDSHPKTPAERYEYVREEYLNSFYATEDKLMSRFKGNPIRGRLWNIASVNGMFSRLVGGNVTGYRPATACEVMSWMAGHTDDFLALEDGEALLRELERYV